MDDLDDDMAMVVGCCTPARDDNALMAVLVYRPWASKLGQEDLDVVDHMPIKAPFHPLDDYSQGLRGPIHGYWSDVLLEALKSPF